MQKHDGSKGVWKKKTKAKKKPEKNTEMKWAKKECGKGKWDNCIVWRGEERTKRSRKG